MHNPLGKAFLALLVISTLLFSCQKELGFQRDANENDGNPTDSTGIPQDSTYDLPGNYTFIGAGGDLNVIARPAMGGGTSRIEAKAWFISTQNAGDVTVSGTQFQFNGLAYVIDTTAQVKTYLNGTLVDDSEQAFNMELAPYDGNAAYTTSTNDSIFFTNGLVLPSYGSGTLQADPLSMKVDWRNDTLILSGNVHATGSDTINGIPVTLDVRGAQTIRFKRRD